MSNLSESSSQAVLQQGETAKSGSDGRAPVDEREAIAHRRCKAYKDGLGGEEPPIGLALSGGGIRSATFCLGLLRGLAQNRMLRRFDYLSTVSGGGYIGAAVGRLFKRFDANEVERRLASADSQELAWLRKNGRYLTPAGSRDYGMAIATMMRSWLSTHFELGLMALLVALLIVSPHMLYVNFAGHGLDWPNGISAWIPLACAAWLALAPGAILVYWPMRERSAINAPTGAGPDTSHWRRTLCELLVQIAVGAGVAWWSLHAVLGVCQIVGACLPMLQETAAILSVLPVWSAAIAALGLFARGIGLLLRVGGTRLDPDTCAKQRNRLTVSLRRANNITAVLLLFGLLDSLTWWLAHINHLPAGVLASLAAIGGMLLAVLRSLPEPLLKAGVSQEGQTARWLPWLINAAGVVLGSALLVLWIELAQWLIFDAQFVPIEPWSAGLRWAALAGAVFAWQALTSFNRDTINNSTLHGFYRARLIRAYVSLGNRLRFPVNARAASGRIEETTVSVADVLHNDDVEIADYQPETNGGPIHLIGACLNQTRDDHGALYNADRKGAAIIANWRGVEVGPQRKWFTETERSSLGRWITVSGAAAAPGAGSRTTLGWAILLFLVGVRLGLWSRAAAGAAPQMAGAPPNGLLDNTKQGLLLDEAFADFTGLHAQNWFLSDGGHFENTGVYALIKRELPFILLADCGADPKYQFEDLENLVRKARIDFDAEIQFYDQSTASQQFGDLADSIHVLSPEQMIDNQSLRGVMLARIVYHRSTDAEPRSGVLMIVKPNLHRALDTDVLAYASRNPVFPQQSTADQFFDEAQWESYHRLGEDFGRCLGRDALARFWNTAPNTRTQLNALSSAERAASTPAAAENPPFWRRGSAVAVGAGASAGLLGTLLVAGGPMLDQLKKWRDEQVVQQHADVDRRETNFQGIRKAFAEFEAKKKALTEYPLPETEAALRHALRVWHGHENDLRLYSFALLQADIERYCNSEDPRAAKPEKLCAGLAFAWPTPVAKDEEVTALVSYGAELRDRVAQMLKQIESAEAEGVDLPKGTTEKLAELKEETQALSDSTEYDRVAGYINAKRDDRNLSLLCEPQSSTFHALPRPVQYCALQAFAPSCVKSYWGFCGAASPKMHPAESAETAASAAAPSAPQASVPPVSPVPTPSSAQTTSVHPPLPPAPAAEPSPAAAQGADVPLLRCRKDSIPVQIYVQVYDEATRAEVERIGKKFRSGDATIEGIENVVATAARRNAPPPIAWKSPTLIHHLSADEGCANDFKTWLDKRLPLLYGAGAQTQIRALPEVFHSDRHVLELWLPTPK